jgi:beta-lactamase class D
MRTTSALILVLTLLNASACARPEGGARGRAQTQTANAVASYLEQEKAERVGAEKMKAYVEGLNYGNRDTSGGLTRFWLNSSLRISADEQIEFLKALYREQLPVSKRTFGIFKEIMVLEETPDYKLSAKTGGGPAGEGKALGWFVGYLETRGNVYFFATQIEGPNFLAIRDERIRLTRSILKDLGHMN